MDFTAGLGVALAGSFGVSTLAGSLGVSTLATFGVAGLSAGAASILAGCSAFTVFFGGSSSSSLPRVLFR